MDEKMPSVDIVVCAHKNKELTERCLESLFNLDYSNYKVILVDDCSMDGSPEFFRNKYSPLLVIENKKNLGPAKTRNVGIMAGRGKYLVTMDNDAFLSADWLKKMVDLMEGDKNIGQATGKTLFADDKTKIADAGGSMEFRGKGYDIGLGSDVTNNKYNQQRGVLYACSSAMIVRRDVTNLVDGFDPVYYYGYEDTDLSFKINLAGYKVVYYPPAISYHGLSKTVSKTIDWKNGYYRSTRNRLLLMLKNYSAEDLLKYLPLNIKFTIFECLRCPKKIVLALKSWFWIILHILSILRKRSRINKIRKINDEKIHSLFNLD